MAIIVKADYNVVFAYNGKKVTTKYNGKKHQVLFKLACDDTNLRESIALAKVSENIIMLDYQGLANTPEYLSLIGDTGVYIARTFEFGNNFTEADIQGVLDETPSGITPIIKLQNDFNNLELIYKLCNQFPRVRFCGGHLFCLSDCRIGCCGLDIMEKSGIKYSVDSYNKTGCCCALEVVDYMGLELEASTKTVKQSSPRTPKEKKPNKPRKTMKFSDLLYANGKVDL